MRFKWSVTTERREDALWSIPGTFVNQGVEIKTRFDYRCQMDGNLMGERNKRVIKSWLLGVWTVFRALPSSSKSIEMVEASTSPDLGVPPSHSPARSSSIWIVHRFRVEIWDLNPSTGAFRTFRVGSCVNRKNVYRYIFAASSDAFEDRFQLPVSSRWKSTDQENQRWLRLGTFELSHNWELPWMREEFHIDVPCSHRLGCSMRMADFFEKSYVMTMSMA